MLSSKQTHEGFENIPEFLNWPMIYIFFIISIIIFPNLLSSKVLL